MSRCLVVLLTVCTLLSLPAAAEAERRTRVGPAALYHHADFISDAFEQTTDPPRIPDIGAAFSLGIAVTHIEPLSDVLGLLVALRMAGPVAVADDGGGRPLSDYKSPRVVGDGIIGLSRVWGRADTPQFDIGGGLYFVNMMIKGTDASVPSVDSRLIGGIAVEGAVGLPLTDATDFFVAGSAGYGFFPLTTGTRRTNSILGAGFNSGVQFRY